MPSVKYSVVFLLDLLFTGLVKERLYKSYDSWLILYIVQLNKKLAIKQTEFFKTNNKLINPNSNTLAY